MDEQKPFPAGNLFSVKEHFENLRILTLFDVRALRILTKPLHLPFLGI
jgi:hypothetical protein